MKCSTWNTPCRTPSAKARTRAQARALPSVLVPPRSSRSEDSSKGAGERLVREAFPAATILRPSLVFGTEDQLFNRFAAMARLLPVMPVICGDTRFQPVYVGDVADAVMAALARADAAGAVYELGGPRVLSMRELLATSLHVSLSAAVRALGVSERSLQRQLRLEGTSFRREVDACADAAAVLAAEGADVAAIE